MLWVKHINKDAYSNPPRVFTLQFFLSHGKELPFREADLPKGDVKKASCIKALTAILLKNRLGVTPEPSADFSPLSTKAPCFLKDADSNQTRMPVNSRWELNRILKRHVQQFASLSGKF